jgi:hypothetical protein
MLWKVQIPPPHLIMLERLKLSTRKRVAIIISIRYKMSASTLDMLMQKQAHLCSASNRRPASNEPSKGRLIFQGINYPS